MGDFERTFGAGADAEAIIARFSHEFDEPVVEEKIEYAGDTAFADLGFGLKLYRKASAEALFLESRSMNDDDRIEDGDSAAEEYSDDVGAQLLSMRNKRGWTHALMKVVDGNVIAIRGLSPEHDGVPLAEVLFAFFRARGWRIGTQFSCYGWITDEAGRWHSVDELPIGLAVSGDLCLSDPEISTLPEALTVGGNLKLVRCGRVDFPGSLTVGGDLHLQDTTIREIIDGVTVGGRVFVGRFEVVLPRLERPEGDFGDFLTPRRRKATVGGDLHMDISMASALPEGATVIGRHWLQLKELVGRLPSGVKCKLPGTDEVVSGDGLQAAIDIRKKNLEDGWK